MSSKLTSSSLRVGVLSDAALERNGVGSFYADLACTLGERFERFELAAPGGQRSFGRLSMPLIGDSTQRLTLPSAKQLRRWFDDLDPHVVILPTPGPFGFLGLLQAERRGVPVVAGLHTQFLSLASLYWRPPVSWVYHSYLVPSHRILLRRAQRVAAASDQLAGQLRRFRPDMSVLGTPLAPSFFERPPSTRSFERRLVYVGRLALEKRIDRVLAVAESRPEWSVTIVGDGPLRREVRRAARQLPNLEWRGWQSRDGVVATLDQNDVLLLPSTVEAFGTVVLEAMARGLLPVVSDGCGINESFVLSRHLFAFRDDGDLERQLERIAGLEPEARAQRRLEAAAAAQLATERALDQWTELLSYTALHGRTPATRSRFRRAILART